MAVICGNSEGIKSNRDESYGEKLSINYLMSVQSSAKALQSVHISPTMFELFGGYTYSDTFIYFRL